MAFIRDSTIILKKMNVRPSTDFFQMHVEHRGFICCGCLLITVNFIGQIMALISGGIIADGGEVARGYLIAQTVVIGLPLFLLFPLGLGFAGARGQETSEPGLETMGLAMAGRSLGTKGQGDRARDGGQVSKMWLGVKGRIFD